MRIVDRSDWLLLQLSADGLRCSNRLRAARLSSFGLLVHGTASYSFYGKLEGALPGRSWYLVTAKVLVDQLLWAPAYAILFLSWVSMLEGKGISGAAAKIHDAFLVQARAHTPATLQRQRASALVQGQMQCSLR